MQAGLLAAWLLVSRTPAAIRHPVDSNLISVLVQCTLMDVPTEAESWRVMRITELA